jgi:hypothetical protein
MGNSKENARREKYREYLEEELEADAYNDDVDTVQPDYEAEELGNLDASTADRESQPMHAHMLSRTARLKREPSNGSTTTRRPCKREPYPE